MSHGQRWQKHDGGKECPVMSDDMVMVETYAKPFTARADALQWKEIKWYRVEEKNDESV